MPRLVEIGSPLSDFATLALGGAAGAAQGIARANEGNLARDQQYGIAAFHSKLQQAQDDRATANDAGLYSIKQQMAQRRAEADRKKRADEWALVEPHLGELEPAARELGKLRYIEKGEIIAPIAKVAAGVTPDVAAKIEADASKLGITLDAKAAEGDKNRETQTTIAGMRTEQQQAANEERARHNAALEEIARSGGDTSKLRASEVERHNREIERIGAQKAGRQATPSTAYKTAADTIASGDPSNVIKALNSADAAAANQVAGELSRWAQTVPVDEGIARLEALAGKLPRSWAGFGGESDTVAARLLKQARQTLEARRASGAAPAPGQAGAAPAPAARAPIDRTPAPWDANDAAALEQELKTLPPAQYEALKAAARQRGILGPTPELLDLYRELFGRDQ